MSDWVKVSMEDNLVHDFEIEKEVQGILKNKKENLGQNNSRLYEIELDDGVITAVWGSTVLDNKMSKVAMGQQVKIVYLGMETNPKTKRSYKNFDVYYKDVETEEEIDFGFDIENI